MISAPPKITAAAVQASSIFLDRDRTIERACELIREAGASGADIAVFSEGFVPGHPLWFHFHPATGRVAREFSLRLAMNAVDIPGPATDRLCRAAKDAGCIVVMGLCQRSPTSGGTLFNSQLFIDRDGSILGVHQKLTPTRGERVVHAPGSGAGLIVPNAAFGPLSGLICGENSNPLAIFSLMARGTLVHAMSWPDIGGRGRLDRGDRALVASRSFAFTTKSYVINAVGVLGVEARDALAASDEDRDFLARPEITGGSSIVDPSGTVIAGPLGAEEEILLAELDLGRCAEEKLAHDFAGHYNRSDVFTLHVRRTEPVLYEEHDDHGPVNPVGLPSDVDPYGFGTD